MTIIKHEIRTGSYYDSIVLMQLQRALASLEGVLDAGVVMGTPTNLALLAEGDLLPPEAEGTKPDDLVIVVQAQDERSAVSALSQVDELLSRRQGTASEFHPRSLESAIKMLPDARWVLVSVPGRYAAGVARKALHLGRNVFLFSDNVSLSDEVELKQTALEKGLLVMGPDCGTAIINGVGFGFANHVRRGRIGLHGSALPR
jgi:FdrA protein